MDQKLKTYSHKTSNIKLSRKDIIKGLQFPENISKELAYLCGVLAGDGNIHIREHKYDYTIKCVGNPADEIAFYQKIVAPLFQEVFNLTLKIGYKDKRTTFGFVAHSKALCTYLTEIIQLPKGKKHPSLRIPKIFLNSKELKIAFLRGLFDTDGCVSFKRKYKLFPYYPVISISSKSKNFIKQVSYFLKDSQFKIVELYDQYVKDKRNKKGFTIINKIELNGANNLHKWLDKIGFSNPKHLEKIKKSSAGRI